MDAVVASGLALARAIAPVYSTLPNVRAVLLGGSVARGLADRYSDLELGVFWDTLPSEDDRRRAIARLGGELFSSASFPPYPADPEWVVSEHYRVTAIDSAGKRFTGASNINPHHFTVAGMERCLAAVLDRCDIAPEKHEVLSAVQHGIPLYGAALLDLWQARTASYPAALACRVIRRRLWFGPGFVPECLAGRDDILLLYHHFLETERCIVQVLAALNRVYAPSPEAKWMDWTIGQLRLAPPDLSRRLKQVFRTEPLAGGRELRTLVHETLDLLESHLPEVNTPSPNDPRPRVNIEWARKRFADPPWPGYSLLDAIGADRPSA